MPKPTLDLYIGQKIIAITRGDEEWEWGLKLESGVEIRNKNKEDTFRPMRLVNYRLGAISMSTRDTTVHFMGPSAAKVTVSFAPTAYTICDPSYGDEVYPQWPEELDEMGITANEGNAPPNPEPVDSEVWAKAEEDLISAADRRHANDATGFLQEDENA